jgi:hypothetical protein
MFSAKVIKISRKADGYVVGEICASCAFLESYHLPRMSWKYCDPAMREITATVLVRGIKLITEMTDCVKRKKEI